MKFSRKKPPSDFQRRAASGPRCLSDGSIAPSSLLAKSPANPFMPFPSTGTGLSVLAGRGSMRSFRPSAFSLWLAEAQLRLKIKQKAAHRGEASTPSKHCPSSQRPADSLFPDADEVRIEAALLHKLLMPPALDDPPLVEHEDLDPPCARWKDGVRS